MARFSQKGNAEAALRGRTGGRRGVATLRAYHMCGCGHTLRAIRFRANTSEHRVDAAEEKLCLASADMTTSRFVCRTLRKGQTSTHV